MLRKINFKTDYVLLFNTENNPDSSIKYLTGINCDYGILLLTKNKKPTLFLSSLEKKPSNKDVQIKTLKSFEEIFSKIEQDSSKKIGLNYTKISKALYDFLRSKIKKIKFTDISKIILENRKEKDREEIKKIKKAVEITEEIFSSLFKTFKTFKTEFEAVQHIKKKIIEFGVEQSFEPIVASGTNSSNPHYFPKENSPLKKGFCIIDMGVKHEGYCSDMTRTIFIGSPSKKEISFYETVLNEVKSLSETITSKTKKITTSFKMIHALGHGVGLDVHEQPMVGTEALNKNAVIALEPAIYNKKIGGVRIEDNYLVKEKSIERLGTLTQELKIIKNPFAK